MNADWRNAKDELMSSLQNLKIWVDLDAPQWCRNALKKEIDQDIRSPRPYKEFESFYRQLPLGTLGCTAATICSCNRLQMDVSLQLAKANKLVPNKV